jgi:hypothetical protein
MEFNTKNQPQGALHKLKSSFNEIFGKSEVVNQEVKNPREDIIEKDFKKSE